MALSNKEKLILGEIVKSFISCAAPVSSSAIAKNRRMPMSAATIRNIMAELESKGYIFQPHTSAGRVPKTPAYRTYVDNIMKRGRISSNEKDQICEPIQQYDSEFDEILKEVTRILAHLSNQLGVIITPQLAKGTFQRLELVPLASDKVLMVISIESGLLKTITLELDSTVSHDRLYLVSQVLNERLSGMPIKDIRYRFAEIVRDMSYDDTGVMQLISQKSRRLFDFDEGSDVYAMGTHHIMQKSDFSDMTVVSSVVELLENKDVMVHLLSSEDENNTPTSVKIGEEIPEQRMIECSLITARYRVGKVDGVIGIIGPKRMDYSKLVALVDFTARTITEKYGKN